VTTRVAIDVSGLARHQRTGVQNLYWAYVQAWRENPDLLEGIELTFYDRSGRCNEALRALAGGAYRALAPAGLPEPLGRALYLLCRTPFVPWPRADGAIHHVWNWGLYAPRGAPGSITVPDLLPLEYPQWFTRRFRRSTERALRFARERARYVFAISGYVRDQLVQATGLPAQQVRVAYPGIDPSYFAPPDAALEEQLLQRHGLRRGRYLISSGFLDPRKNLPRQLRAFAAATSGEHADTRYVLTGLATAHSGEVLELIHTPALRERVVFLGYLPREQLKALIGASAAMLYCSLAEGFGLPILEAMAAGAPVLTSATSSMRELAEGRALTVDPLQVDAIAAAIGRLLGEGRAAALAQAAANRDYARGFTIRNWLDAHLRAWRS
jgi:alpha-1,3-rhamnosyl/mannosyltransferase